MRLLVLVADAWGGNGGIAQYNRDLLGALLTSGVEIRMCCYSAALVKDVPKGVELLYQGRSRVQFSVNAMRAAKDIDAVFCGHLHLAFPASLCARRAKAPFWIQVHGVEAWKRPSPYRNWAMQRADLITAVSRHTRKRLLSWLAGAPERVRVLPDTVADQFTPGASPEALRKQLGLAGAKVLLTVGRLAAGERYKGHESVIGALPELMSNCGSVKYVIVGTGDDRPRLEQLAAERGVAKNVIFAGHVSPSELPDYYRLADVFVMPSTGEGFGIAFLEAMACGTPAIGMAVDGSRDPLSLPSGFTLENIGDLPRAIQSVLNAPVRQRVAYGAERFARRGFVERATALALMLTDTGARTTPQPTYKRI